MKPQNISILILVLHKLKSFSTVHQPELLSQVIPDQEKKEGRHCLAWLQTTSSTLEKIMNVQLRTVGNWGEQVEEIASTIRFWQN